MQVQSFQPDFNSNCTICDTSPTVIVSDHICPDTLLCGIHFFASRAMADWEEWNNQPEATE